LRLGLFGGSFDPFHLGHFLISRTALENFRLQKVVFLPCAHSPLKKANPVAGDTARMSMLQQGLKGQSWAEVSDWEIRQGGVSFTVDTARAWAQRYPKAAIYWIMGSDQWEALDSWKEPRELGRLLHFLVFPRPKNPTPRRGFRMSEIPLRLDISATVIRSRLKRGLSVEGLVLPGVEKTIRRSRLYR
jgi:nicotinate-nucleotide adenylyltransferase